MFGSLHRFTFNKSTWFLQKFIKLLLLIVVVVIIISPKIFLSIFIFCQTHGVAYLWVQADSLVFTVLKFFLPLKLLKDLHLSCYTM